MRSDRIAPWSLEGNPLLSVFLPFDWKKKKSVQVFLFFKNTLISTNNCDIPFLRTKRKSDALVGGAFRGGKQSQRTAQEIEIHQNSKESIALLLWTRFQSKNTLLTLSLMMADESDDLRVSRKFGDHEPRRTSAGFNSSAGVAEARRPRRMFGERGHLTFAPISVPWAHFFDFSVHQIRRDLFVCWFLS